MGWREHLRPVRAEWEVVALVAVWRSRKQSSSYSRMPRMRFSRRQIACTGDVHEMWSACVSLQNLHRHNVRVQVKSVLPRDAEAPCARALFAALPASRAE